MGRYPVVVLPLHSQETSLLTLTVHQDPGLSIVSVHVQHQASAPARLRRAEAWLARSDLIQVCRSCQLLGGHLLCGNQLYAGLFPFPGLVRAVGRGTGPHKLVNRDWVRGPLESQAEGRKWPPPQRFLPTPRCPLLPSFHFRNLRAFWEASQHLDRSSLSRFAAGEKPILQAWRR